MFAAAPVLLVAAAFVFAKAGRNALFVQGPGILDLPGGNGNTSMEHRLAIHRLSIR